LLELLNLPVGGAHVPGVRLSWLKDGIDFLQFFVLVPLRLSLVFLVPLFLLGVVSIHHLLIWCLVFNIIVPVDVVVAGAVHLLV